MIAELFISFIIISVFTLVLHMTHFLQVSKDLLQHVYQGVGAMTDIQMDDYEKELRIRRSGIDIFIGVGSLVWRFILCIVFAYIPIYLSDKLNLAKENEIFSLMLRSDYIVVVSVALMSIVWLGRKKLNAVDGAETHAASYSMSDRILHMIAFANPSIQRFSARVDDSIFRFIHPSLEPQPPIFITSLPRGGTTALLNAFSELPCIATHTYRDMPFITSPYLWNKIAVPFRRKVARRMRAHGDGLEIDLDSPEAFEEVYWKLFWHEKYKKKKIILWTQEDEQYKFTKSLQMCFKKIPYIRGRPTARYLSKNNANIARLQMIRHIFPQAQVVVPIRAPAPHAASLFRQHQNFLKQQEDDEFIQRYMLDIGHLEFGLLHTPIEFRGFDRGAYSPDSPDYWLAYWIAAFTEVLANIDFCLVVLQDDLRANSHSCMSHLLDKLGLENTGQDFNTYFRKDVDDTDKSIFTSDLLAVAESLYNKISNKALG